MRSAAPRDACRMSEAPNQLSVTGRTKCWFGLMYIALIFLLFAFGVLLMMLAAVLHIGKDNWDEANEISGSPKKAFLSEVDPELGGRRGIRVSKELEKAGVDSQRQTCPLVRPKLGVVKFVVSRMTRQAARSKCTREMAGLVEIHLGPVFLGANSLATSYAAIERFGRAQGLHAGKQYHLWVPREGGLGIHSAEALLEADGTRTNGHGRGMKPNQYTHSRVAVGE